MDLRSSCRSPSSKLWFLQVPAAVVSHAIGDTLFWPLTYVCVWPSPWRPWSPSRCVFEVDRSRWRVCREGGSRRWCRYGHRNYLTSPDQVRFFCRGSGQSICSVVCSASVMCVCWRYIKKTHGDIVKEIQEMLSSLQARSRHGPLHPPTGSHQDASDISCFGTSWFVGNDDSDSVQMWSPSPSSKSCHPSLTKLLTNLSQYESSHSAYISTTLNPQQHPEQPEQPEQFEWCVDPNDLKPWRTPSPNNSTTQNHPITQTK